MSLGSCSADVLVMLKSAVKGSGSACKMRSGLVCWSLLSACTADVLSRVLGLSSECCLVLSAAGLLSACTAGLDDAEVLDN